MKRKLPLVLFRWLMMDPDTRIKLTHMEEEKGQRLLSTIFAAERDVLDLILEEDGIGPIDIEDTYFVPEPEASEQSIPLDNSSDSTAAPPTPSTAPTIRESTYEISRQTHQENSTDPAVARPQGTGAPFTFSASPDASPGPNSNFVFRMRSLTLGEAETHEERSEVAARASQVSDPAVRAIRTLEDAAGSPDVVLPVVASPSSVTPSTASGDRLTPTGSSTRGPASPSRRLNSVSTSGESPTRRSFSQASAPVRTEPLPLDHISEDAAVYRRLIERLVAAARRANFPNDGPLHLSALHAALPTVGDGLESLVNNPAVRFRSVSQLERDKMIGAAGELYVSRTLGVPTMAKIGTFAPLQHVNDFLWTGIRAAEKSDAGVAPVFAGLLAEHHQKLRKRASGICYPKSMARTRDLGSCVRRHGWSLYSASY